VPIKTSIGDTVSDMEYVVEYGPRIQSVQGLLKLLQSTCEELTARN